MKPSAPHVRIPLQEKTSRCFQFWTLRSLYLPCVSRLVLILREEERVNSLFLESNRHCQCESMETNRIRGFFWFNLKKTLDGVAGI